MTRKTIVGVEPAEKTQTDGPEGLKTTLPQEPAVSSPTDSLGWLVTPAPLCEAHDTKGGTIRRCGKPAVQKVTIFTDEGYWVRVWTCAKHKPKGNTRR